MQNFIEQFIMRTSLFIGVLVFYPTVSIIILTAYLFSFIVLILLSVFLYPYALAKAIVEPEYLTGEDDE